MNLINESITAYNAGRMDEAVNWATGLDHVQGLLPMRGGLHWSFSPSITA